MPPIEKKCSDPLVEKGLAVTAAASTTTSATFSVPSSRGDVLGVQIFVGDTALADLINDTINIYVNGIAVYENVPVLKFASLFASSNNEFPLEARESSQINIKVTNANATAFVVHFNFLFRRPR